MSKSSLGENAFLMQEATGEGPGFFEVLGSQLDTAKVWRR